ncbi:DNA gyrase inhibitor YacG [Ningiella sp. W23]|uniref:DNA gyrase inhibitor YacG n=1 Tax=Ningiella sp. W23 TaxID=3023715 RepID=UPI003757E6F2
MPTTVNCPTCNNDVVWSKESHFRPFCSKRCQLIDLGQWANEENKLPAGGNKDAETPSHIDVEDIEAMLAQQEQDFFKS